MCDVFLMSVPRTGMADGGCDDSGDHPAGRVHRGDGVIPVWRGAPSGVISIRTSLGLISIRTSLGLIAIRTSPGDIAS